MLDNQNHLNQSPLISNAVDEPRRCSFQSLLSPFRFVKKVRFPIGNKIAIENYEWIFANRIDQIKEYWKGNDNLFLQNKYLKALEESQTEGLGFRYLLALKDGKAIGGITLQLLNVDAEHSIRSLRMGEINGFWDQIRLLIARWGKYNFLIWGNMFLTGTYNQWWDVPENELPTLKASTLSVLTCLAHQEKIQIIMGRDWLEHETAMEKAGFHAINFQPSMIMELPSHWKTMEDYLNAMSSKYRVRTRRALKKASGVIFRELDLRQIELFNDDLVALHYAVVDQADFNMMWAGKDYFIQLKQQLGANCCLTACFEKDKLLGFFTTIRNGKELEANFLGFDAQANREHQLYLCMLYKMIEQALENHCKKISFARTALEIKSSVGAVAHKTYIYMKHTNPVLNWLLPAIVRFGDPKEEWTPRHPFREE